MHTSKWFRVNRWRYFIIFGFIVISLWMGYFISSSQNYYRTEGKDFFALWLAPKLLIEGKNPYNSLDWISAYDKYGANWVIDAKYLYPLPLAVILMPIGFLPLEYAAIIWIALGILAIMFSVYLVLHAWHTTWQYTYLIPIVIGIFLLRPVAETLRLGQLDWLILFFLVGGFYFWRRNDWLLGGMMIALSVLKPQIGGPILFFVSIWLLLRHRWSGIIGEGIAFFSIYIIGWSFNHAWIGEWLRYGTNKVEENACCTPTLWGFASMTCGFNLKCGFVLGIFLTILLSVFILFLLFRVQDNDSSFAIGLSIPAALLISPYLWTYSQIILILPILLITNILRQKKIAYLLVATFPLVIGLISSSIVYISIGIGVDTISSIVPAIILLILLLFNKNPIIHKEPSILV